MIYSDKIKISLALKILNKIKYKCLIIVSQKKIFLGTLTDGDLRRAILKGAKFSDKINKYIFKESYFLKESEISKININKIYNKGIYAIPILNSKNKVKRVIYPDKKYIFHSKKLNKTDVVIMAGGKGERLEPFTSILPKPLAPIDGIPLLEQIIINLKNYNFNRFVITVNFKKEIIKSYFREVKKKYNINFIEEKYPLGTAGSLRLLPNKISKSFFLTNCDVMVDLNYDDLLKFHNDNNNDMTIVASKKKYIIPYGVLNINNNILKDIDEKPELNFFTNIGLYVLKKNITLEIPKSLKKYDMNQFIQKIIKNKKKKIGIYPVSDESWIDIGQWHEYKNSEMKFKKLFK